MVFYIHDQGMRIQTPLDQLVKQPLRVNSAQAVAAISQRRVEPISGEAAQYQNIADKNERKRAFLAADIMHRSVISVTSTMLIDEVWSLFARHRIHHLPVVDEGRLTGIVSDRDILRASLNANSEKFSLQRIATIMSQPVIAVATDTEIRLIAEVMVRQRIGALPVVDGDETFEKVVGMITRTDLLRVMVDSGPLELWI